MQYQRVMGCSVCHAKLCSGTEGILCHFEANTPLAGEGRGINVASTVICVIGGDGNVCAIIF